MRIVQFYFDFRFLKFIILKIDRLHYIIIDHGYLHNYIIT